MLSFNRDIGIDLGTSNVLIYVRGLGIVINEPSVVILDESTNGIIAVGHEARKILGRTPTNIKAVYPLRDGVIADFNLTEVMLNYFINKLNIKNIFFKLRILICCPTNITDIEKKAIFQVAEKVGGNIVFVEEEPKAAAVGAGMDIFQPFGTMVVDIGGGTTDIAVLSLGDIVVSSSIKVAGNKFDLDIINFIKEKFKLLVGERTAEYIKIQIATVFLQEENKKIEIKGLDLVTGVPKIITICASDLNSTLLSSVQVIIQEIRTVLEQTPPELAADIIDRGIVLTGGGSLVRGLPKIISERLKVPVLLSERPQDCVALGTGILLEKIF